jgi:hypothetical protein
MKTLRKAYKALLTALEVYSEAGRTPPPCLHETLEKLESLYDAKTGNDIHGNQIPPNLKNFGGEGPDPKPGRSPNNPRNKSGVGS